MQNVLFYVRFYRNVDGKSVNTKTRFYHNFLTALNDSDEHEKSGLHNSTELIIKEAL